MMPRSGSLVSRCFALGLLLLVIAVGMQFLFRPLAQAYQGNHAKIHTLTSLLREQETLIGAYQSMTAKLNSAEQPALQQANDTIAAAALQDQVSSIIDKHGGDIKSVRILPSADVEDAPSFQKSIVGIQFSADLAVLANALHDFELAEPVLLVDWLQVIVTDLRADDAEQLDALKLDIRVDVFTFVRRSPDVTP